MKLQKQIIATDLVFKSLLGVLIFFSSLNAFAFEYQEYEKKIKTTYSIQNVIEKFPRREMEDVLRNFVASGRPNRLPNTTGHANSRDYIEAKLKSFTNPGAAFSKQEFTATLEDKKSFTGMNLIWEKKGSITPEQIIYVSAYYDTKIIDAKNQKNAAKAEMTGADNNGTGVAALLSMAEIFNKLDLPKTVKLVFLDVETMNAQGSSHFAKSQDFLNDVAAKKPQGLINVVMIGHDTRAMDIDKKNNNMRIYTRAKSEAQYANDEVFATTLMKSGSKHFNTVNFSLSEETALKSVYIPETIKSYSKVQMPVVSFSQYREGDLNPRLWTSNDFVETLNINTYLNVFKYITSGVLAWNYDVVK